MNRRKFVQSLSILSSLVHFEPVLNCSEPDHVSRDAHKTDLTVRRGIRFNRHVYEIDGTAAYFHAGELDYFRVPKSDWRNRMELFKETGGNCIATYVPWQLHEPVEGTFIFGGKDSIHDLEGYLETASSLGLYVLVRPGPYVYSELRYDGLPLWLCDRYPEVRACTIDGRAFNSYALSYVHPTFLKKVSAWYGEVCRRIENYTVSKGGPVALLQLDNELMGVHLWSGGLDYNTEAMGFGNAYGRYANFLRDRYESIKRVNSLYGTDFTSFAEARPVKAANLSLVSQLRIERDYLDFYIGTVSDYCDTLAKFVHEQRIDVPLIHNSAGPSMNGLFQKICKSLPKGFLLGTDHYYNLSQGDRQNNPTPQLAVDVLCSLETLRIMGYPATVFELQSGSASDWPPVSANDCKAWYWTNLAFGMRGFNFYIFNGGPNPPDMGITTDVYDFAAPVGVDGTIRSLYTVQKEFGQFLRENRWLLQAKRETDCRIGFDFDQMRAPYYWKQASQITPSSSEIWDFMRKGLLTSALCASFSPAACDLESDEWIHTTDSPLMVASAQCMANDKQERLVRFLRNGGKVLLGPVLPSLDENFEPCTVLSDFLGKPKIIPNTNSAVRVSIDGIENIRNNGTVYITERLPGGASVLGTDEFSQRTVAWSVTTERQGECIFLGLKWSHAMRQHDRMIARLLERLGARRKIESSNPNVWSSLWSYGGKSGIFLMNLFTGTVEATISCRPEAHDFAVNLGPQTIEAMSVKYLGV